MKKLHGRWWTVWGDPLRIYAPGWARVTGADKEIILIEKGLHDEILEDFADVIKMLEEALIKAGYTDGSQKVLNKLTVWKMNHHELQRPDCNLQETDTSGSCFQNQGGSGTV
jgi:hypothetical protein